MKTERAHAGIWGLLVGDALGVPYEFHDASEIPPANRIELIPPDGFRRAHPGVPPGTWSDDGAQALCLLASLLACGSVDTTDLGERFVRWLRRGYMAVDERVFDVGITTLRALENIEAGVPAERAGPAGERDNGNGSLMRVLPLALWHGGSDEDLIRDAMRQSRVTHGHLRSQLCCALYSMWARRVMNGDGRPWPGAVAAVRRAVGEDPASRDELDGPIAVDRDPGGGGSGYVVDCLHSARLCLEAGAYEQVVIAAIGLGDDTDTTAAVAGGIAALRDGLDGIPARWLAGLRGRAMVEALLARWRKPAM